MRSRCHGEQPSVQQVLGIKSAVAVLEATPADKKPTVCFMFPGLTADPDNRLPDSPNTLIALRALGTVMSESGSTEGGDSGIPAAFTYFGQFIDHDITKTIFDATLTPPGQSDAIENTALMPLPPEIILKLADNVRSFQLDLDSLYGGDVPTQATHADGTLKLSAVSPIDDGLGPIATEDPLHDLMRKPRIARPVTEKEREDDRAAIIGDPRNDENLVVGQLHVAFVRAHNALIKRGLTADEARTQLRRRYQWAVIHDFLPTICDKSIVDDILKNGNKAWKVDSPEEALMPLEFSGAAYRFGHSMIRGVYEYNDTFHAGGLLGPATLSLLFTFTALQGELTPAQGGGDVSQGPETLPRNWIIDWARFFDAEVNPARRIDTQLTPELAFLRDFQGVPFETMMARLATRNLLRGYLLGLPTGQAVARHLGEAPLARDVIVSAMPPDQLKLLDSAGLVDRTPLWFYILAEAGDPAGANGHHLGAVGSRIVAETLITICRFSADSVLQDPPSDSELSTGEFSLKGIVKLGLDAAFELP